MKASANILLSMCIGAALTAGLSGCGRSALAQGTSRSTEAPAAQTKGNAAEITDDQKKMLYAFGAALANNLKDFRLSSEERKVVQDAFLAVSGGEQPKVDVSEYMPKIRTLYSERQQQLAVEEKAAGAAYLAQVAKEPGAVKLENGLVMRTLKPGKGAKPTEKDTVKVTFATMSIDGATIDSTKEQGNKPTELPMNAMIPCWSHGISRMQVGSKSRLVCSSDLAHGDSGAPPKIKPGATLIFDVELLEIIKPPPEEKKPGGNS